MIGDNPGHPSKTHSRNLPAYTKRVVCVYEGGMNKIVAFCSIQPPDVIMVDEVPFGLLKVTPRMIMYKQIVDKVSGVLGEYFKPNQV